ncbi:protease inhibitor I42 family protein [Streptomyces sp. YU58]|uniref:protease inhibitor I42 family protein n=1 Tax=Streptomyces sp. SX92 TaxID=3158972 RepID=UPI0027B8D621|nr:protease inhibitor I42 family protein [Streptomyces coralus]WLW51318.1 protease inhibitor I42 family protein [Streptomyces coralus]
MTRILKSLPRTPAALLLTLLVSLTSATALTGCGSSASADGEYGTGERTLKVEAGQKFSLKVPTSAATGENWYLAGPRPATDVLSYRGKRDESDGDSASQYFDFTAAGPGTTTVRLLNCPNALCHDASASAAPFPKPTDPLRPYATATGTANPEDWPAYFVYEVTVD